MTIEYNINVPSGGSVLTWTFVGPLMISFSQDGIMPADRFDEYVAAVEARTFSHVLGLGQGGIKVTSVQRKKIAEMLGRKQIVVVIDSAITRGIITALGWLGLQIKSYDWKNLDIASRELRVPDIDPAEIVKISRALRDTSLGSMLCAASNL